MREYKFYLICKDGHVSGPPAEHDLLNDEAAIAEASLAAATNDVEIWQGARMVAYVDRHYE